MKVFFDQLAVSMSYRKDSQPGEQFKRMGAATSTLMTEQKARQAIEARPVQDEEDMSLGGGLSVAARESQWLRPPSGCTLD